MSLLNGRFTHLITVDKPLALFSDKLCVCWSRATEGLLSAVTLRYWCHLTPGAQNSSALLLVRSLCATLILSPMQWDHRSLQECLGHRQAIVYSVCIWNSALKRPTKSDKWMACFKNNILINITSWWHSSESGTNYDDTNYNFTSTQVFYQADWGARWQCKTGCHQLCHLGVPWFCIFTFAGTLLGLQSDVGSKTVPLGDTGGVSFHR